MRKHEPSLVTALAMAGDLAAALATVRASLAAAEGRAAGNLVELAELDALSARDAIEKAVWELDLTSAGTTDPGWEVPTRPAFPAQGTVAPGTGHPPEVALSPRLVRRSRRPVIVVGQGELF